MHCYERLVGIMKQQGVYCAWVVDVINITDFYFLKRYIKTPL